MNDFPDFSRHHYQIVQELGHNRAGGRVTYIATDTKTQQQVVIKQFQFAKLSSRWSDYDAYDHEIQLLKELNYPGIPRYLNSFQTDDGFCMVQEYKNAQSLAESRSFNPNQIKQIAISALQILVYLQNRIPPIIHRDVKPENILVDHQGTVYLVDFGFARVGEGEVGVSSVVKGTLGFMPPEQIFNRQLTEASDLYGLGMSLICLLTGTKSDQIGDLVDISYRVSFKHLVPKLNIHWVTWLEKMVEPRLKHRYPNALAALEAIPPSPLRPPEAQFSKTKLEFSATRLDSLLTQTVVITNPIPETILEGQWKVAPHPQDPTAELYQWISVEPATFVSNQVECNVTINTHKLIPGKTYTRQLLLHSNTLTKTYTLLLQIQTSPLANQINLRPYGLLLLLCLSSLGTSWLVAWVTLVMATIAASSEMVGVGVTVGTAIGLECSAWLLRSSNWRIGATTCSLAAVLVAIIAVQKALTGEFIYMGSAAITGTGLGALGGAIFGLTLGSITEHLATQAHSKPLFISVSLLVSILGTALGLGLTFSFSHPFVLCLLSTTSLLLITFAIHLYLQHVKKSSLQSAHRPLIKP
jgi:serine/threonine protein kinase